MRIGLGILAVVHSESLKDLFVKEVVFRVEILKKILPETLFFFLLAFTFVSELRFVE